MTLERVARWAAWVILAVIAYSTLAPIEARPFNTDSLPWAEAQRFLAFGALGAAFAVGYPHREGAVISGLIILVAGLEVMQALIPGRHARIDDGFLKAAAALAGCGLAFLHPSAGRRP